MWNQFTVLLAPIEPLLSIYLNVPILVYILVYILLICIYFPSKTNPNLNCSKRRFRFEINDLFLVNSAYASVRALANFLAGYGL